MMAKIVSGMSDSLALSVLRAWELGRKPSILCPAMNTVMWTHPVTKESIDKLINWGHEVVPPISKRLACDDVGSGALADVKTIVETVQLHCRDKIESNINNSHQYNSEFLESYFRSKRKSRLSGKHVLLLTTAMIASIWICSGYILNRREV